MTAKYPDPFSSGTSERMRLTGPAPDGELSRAARTLARLCVRNGGDPADLALALGAVGVLDVDAALGAARRLASGERALPAVATVPGPSSHPGPSTPGEPRSSPHGPSQGQHGASL